MVSVEKSNVVNNRYILREKLAEGGMGIVFRATDRLTGKDIALKQVKLVPQLQNEVSTAADSLAERNALALEFRAMASIRHPNIISVLDFGFLEDETPFFTMEYLEDFQDFFTAGIMQSVEGKIDLLINLLDTLEYLHRRGLLHRDIKPGNVAVYKDTVQVLDFGLSVDNETLQQDDEDIKIVGTLAYMAPEVLQGEKATASSDLYAVGIMAYEVFVGVHPFTSENVSNLLFKIITEHPDYSVLEKINVYSPNSQIQPASDISAQTTVAFHKGLSDEDQASLHEPKPDYNDGSELSNPLSLTISRLLAKSAEDRYSRASDVIRDLNNVLDRDMVDESTSVRESYLQSARFVGREGELGALQDALDDALKHHGSAWLIGGETGVGKSRLIDELRILALIHGFTTVRGHALSNNNISYQLWRDPVRRMILHTTVSDIDARILKEIVNDIERLLNRDVNDPESLDGDKHRERMQASILNLFNDIHFPLLLILEDIQWEQNSIDTLNRLSTILKDKSILLVVTYRQDEAPNLAETMPDFKLLSLKRLRRVDITKLGESIIGTTDTLNQIVDLLYRETGGNVYFIIEILRELAEYSGSLISIDSATLKEDISSAGVLDILQKRLTELPQEALNLLKLAALIGREINLGVINQIDTELDHDTWLVLCSNASILDTTEEGQWRFVHDAMRRTVLNAIHIPETQGLHQTLAIAFEKVYGYQTEHAIVLATHWRYAENYTKEYQYTRIAAEYALHIGDLHEARGLFERIIDLIDTQETVTSELSDRAQIEINLVKTLHILGDYEAALDISTTTVSKLRDSEHSKLLAEALIEQGEVLKRQGNINQADEMVQEALNILTPLDHKAGIIYALDRLSDLKYEQGDYTSALEHGERAIAIATESGHDSRMGSLLTNLGQVAFATGQYELAQQHWSKAREIHIRAGQRREVALLEMNMGSVAGQTGDLETCSENFQNALKVFKTIGDKRLIGVTLNNLGFVASLKSDFFTSIEYYDESLKIARSIKSLGETCFVLLNLGDVIMQIGNTEQAKANFWEALKLSIDSSATPIILESFSYIIQLYESEAIVPIVIGHVLNNPASNQETRERCEDVLEKLRGQATESELEALLEKGKAIVLDDLVTQILDRLEA